MPSQVSKLQIQIFSDAFGAGQIRLDEPLSNHTYMKIGGPADILIQVNSSEQLIKAYRLGLKVQLPIFLLGSGSNLLVSDKGIRGLVIKNRADDIKLSSFQGGIKNKQVAVSGAVVEAESGVITNHLVRHTIEEGLAGLEYFLGLPGTVGGAIYNNSHYQDQLFGDYILQVLVLDSKGQEKTYTQAQMKFKYDYSVLHQTQELVISAKFSLRGGNKTELWKKATDCAKNRANTQPLSLPSSGCMFKNLSLSQANLLGLSHQSSGYLIDRAGLKGTRVGAAQISDKHANFIVNKGGATAEDVQKLIKHVRAEVKKKFNITLKPEVFFVGEK